jgi:glyoxylase-like metal-dependent hydrolase (beta-lactamase superfamily II)
MSIHYFNGFTCNARIPRHWISGTLCLLVESGQGLVLIDTGLGTLDYTNMPGILKLFRWVTIVPLIPDETALNQVKGLGFRPEDVRHIVLTHLHFDHAGGLRDFPWAEVHLHRREYEHFKTGKLKSWIDGGYNRRVLDHDPPVHIYAENEERWYDFAAIRLPFEPGMYLLPLFGHTPGHCGVAIRDGEGWWLHVGDAASFADDVPDWLIGILGPHQPRLRAFEAAHPEVRMSTGHMHLDFFQPCKGNTAG